MLILDNVLYGGDDIVSAFVASLIPHVRETGFPRGSRALGIIHNRKLVGGAVYHHFRGHDVEIGFALEGKAGLTRQVLHHLYAHPFVTLGCARATAVTSVNNVKARKLLERMGCTLECIRPLGLTAAEDAAIYGMLRKDCRWLRGHRVDA